MTTITNADFIDFGASNCGSMIFAKKLGGRNGVGIDIDPKKVQQSENNGYRVVCGDVMRVNIAKKCANFCILSHFLEHLESIDQVKVAMEKAIGASKHFVYFQGPFFDADLKLSRLGLKFFWSDWHGHKMHLTSKMLARVLNSLNVSYTITGFEQIENSTSPLIHPTASPTDSFEYDSGKHKAKPNIEFTFPVFREIFGFVWLNNKIPREQMLEKKCTVYKVLYER